MRRVILNRLMQVAAVLILLFICSMYASAEEIDSAYKQICKEAGCEYQVDSALLEAVILKESNGDADAVSADGKNIGLCQLHISYFEGDLYDPENNIHQAAEYLNVLEEQYGNMALALMVYHGESNAKEKYENGEISYYARWILQKAAELREKDMSAKIEFDVDEAIKRLRQGETTSAVAHDIGCGTTTLELRVKKYCAENNIELPIMHRQAIYLEGIDIYDFGKVGALYRAGWSIKQIADEMRSTEDKVKVVINKFRTGELKMSQFLTHPKEEDYV